MRFICLFAFAVAVSFFLSSTPASARFFPNITSIPPWLNATHGAWDSFRNLSGCHPGEKADGLSKLKNYLKHFGYINSTSNFTDDFDSDLKTAIETYQKNFNLNVTGDLDPETVQQIVRPRCGVADIVNGSTTMNSGKTTQSSNATHIHTVSHYTFFPGKPRWPQYNRDLTYAFQPENELTDVVKSVFTRAFNRWSAVTALTFTQTDSWADADLKIGFFVGDHGDGEPFDGLLGTLAHAFSPTSGRLHLDGDENWVVSSDITEATETSAVDLESVAVHEIGHLLGLGHSSVEDAIMYPTIPSRTRKVELASDDISGIQELYGTNPSYNGSTSTTTPSSENEGDTVYGSSAQISGSLWGFKAAMAAGFGLLLVL
ncbi:metalloendoproteinase 2-MMP-like [Juglans microcarpa x Juglans regia]|uniref:metalloendoproteinase 2-MMP-like n=1 Tax=Juglans microcarpa x Juglans regia TaxID=2249226 RepID=UPI001B7E7DCB|nr:metalloendoproteinase 2-MMP-like [Juglans microcarpa x Juglans regia]